jgi:hypothetical protein
MEAGSCNLSLFAGNQYLIFPVVNICTTTVESDGSGDVQPAKQVPNINKGEDIWDIL